MYNQLSKLPDCNFNRYGLRSVSGAASIPFGSKRLKRHKWPSDLKFTDHSASHHIVSNQTAYPSVRSLLLKRSLAEVGVHVLEPGHV